MHLAWWWFTGLGFDHEVPHHSTFSKNRHGRFRNRKYSSRACPNGERRKLCVHHRVQGVSKLDLMITFCTACHAIQERTQIVLGKMTPLLLVLWREKRPEGKEQLYLPLASELPVETEQLMIPVGLES